MATSNDTTPTFITLTKAETALWESEDAIERDDFRRMIRSENSHRCVEIYSHDGITLDAWSGETQWNGRDLDEEA